VPALAPEHRVRVRTELQTHVTRNHARALLA
jgi:hypothetical protein